MSHLTLDEDEKKNKKIGKKKLFTDVRDIKNKRDRAKEVLV
jgi:hypothetical protein